MSNLKQQLIRIGNKEPSLRKHLRPILDVVLSSSDYDRKSDQAKRLVRDMGYDVGPRKDVSISGQGDHLSLTSPDPSLLNILVSELEVELDLKSQGIKDGYGPAWKATLI